MNNELMSDTHRYVSVRRIGNIEIVLGGTDSTFIEANDYK